MPVIVLAGLDRVSMVTLRERNGELAPSQMPGKGFFHLNRDGISRIQCESACIDMIFLRGNDLLHGKRI